MKNDLKIRTLAISGFASVLLYASDRGMKASFIFDHTFFSQKPDMLLPRISDFIQKYYLPCGKHHDQQNPKWKAFLLLERHCDDAGYDFYEALDMIHERIGSRNFYVIFSEINSQIDGRVSGDALEAVR